MVITVLSIYFLQGARYFLIFDEAKKLKAGDNVYLAGVDIGDVKNITLHNGTIQVEIKIDKKNQGQLTNNSRFFIESSSDESNPSSILVKNLKPGGKPLLSNDTIIGISSYIEWHTLELSEKFKNYTDSDQAKQWKKYLAEQKEELEKKLNETDWEQVGQDVKQEFMELKDNIEKTLQSDEAQEMKKDIGENLNKVGKLLKNIGESKEANDLRQSLNNLYKRFEEELSNLDKQEQ